MLGGGHDNTAGPDEGEVVGWRGEEGVLEKEEGLSGTGGEDVSVGEAGEGGGTGASGAGGQGEGEEGSWWLNFSGNEGGG